MSMEFPRLWRWLAASLACLLPACGGPPRPLPPAAPPPAVWRTPQEVSLEQAVQTFYGAPYKPGGTDPSGVDCSGLVQGAFRQADIALPRTVAQQFTAGRPVELGALRFGDVLFFNRYCQVKKSEWFTAGILNPGQLAEVCHNGIYLGDGRFIHASPRGVFISRLDAEVWRTSFVGARRYLAPGP